MKRLHLQLPRALYRTAQLLEILVGAILAVAILISLFFVVLDLGSLIQNSADAGAFQDFLARAFNVIIGLEFLKMLCRHDMDSTVEVLLFAIARQMLVEHTSPLENLLMISAIAILFLIRKYLFPPPSAEDPGESPPAPPEGSART